MKIVVKNLQKKIKINPASIRDTVTKIEPPTRFNNLKIALYFVRNSVIRRLNKQFFHKNRFTDVISFDLEQNYAEIFVAPSVVKCNADIFGVEFDEEMHRCIVHGILHIFGFDDRTKKDLTKMWKRQESILRKIYAIRKRFSSG